MTDDWGFMSTANTPYYTRQVNALPDFAQYYNWSGWTTGGGVFSLATAIADINGDGKADIVLALWETQLNFGVVTNAPTPNRIVILESQPDGTYTDATSALFGTSNPLVLPGQARDVSVGDVNGDGKPDFAYSLSREDGRSSDILSNMIAQSVVLVSQPDDTYIVVNVGAPDWSQSIKIANYGDVGHVYFQGYTNANLSFIYGDPTVGQIVSGIDCILNPAGTAFIINTLPPVSGTGLVVLPPSTENGEISQLITGAGDANGEFPALAVLGNDGNWTITSTLQPFQMTKVPYVAWNGSTAVQASIATVNGEALLGFSCDFYALLNSYYPESPSVAVLNYYGETLPAPDSAGFYHQGGGAIYDHLVFCSAIDNRLVPAPIKIVNEDTSHVFNFIDFLDLTHNGLLDIITYPYRVGGQPCVYLNTGAGVFVKIDLSIFPQAPTEWGNSASAKFLDANGDSIYDLMYWPSNGVYPSSNPWAPSTADNTPQLYIGGQSTLLMGNTYTDAIVISDRITSPLINTFAGNDTIYDTNASTSPTSIDGGLGTDTAVYSGAISNYSISYNRALGTTTITNHQVGGVGVDNLKSIEKLQFADKTFDLLNVPRTQPPAFNTSQSFLFDAAYYLLKNPDLVPTVTLTTAYDNYMTVGAAAGDAPNNWFDPVYYANKWADLKALNLDAATLFMHYNLYGVWEGRSAGPTFDTYDGNRYLTDNPDVAAYVDAYVADFLGSRSNGAIAHYVIYGANEGRHAYDLTGHLIDQAVLIGVAA